MTRAEAIDVLKRTTGNINWDAEREEIYFTDEWVQAYEMAIAALKAQEPKWISVKERLPKCGEEVLVCDARDGFIGKFFLEEMKSDRVYCWYDGDGWRLPNDEITHWLPLPEPPKDGGGADA